MIVVGSEVLPEKMDLENMVKNKLMTKTGLKDRNGKKYKVLDFYPRYVLTEDEVGLKQCWSYQQAMWEMIAV